MSGKRTYFLDALSSHGLSAGSRTCRDGMDPADKPWDDEDVRRRDGENPFNAIKLLIVIFIFGGILLWLITYWCIADPQRQWLLVGLYGWSSGLFITYRIYTLTKRVQQQHGQIKKQ